MALAVHFEVTTDTAGKSRAQRRTIRLDATGELGSGSAADVTVHNISSTGMLIECREALDAGEKLAIDLPQAGPTVATIVWSSGFLHGCAFDKPIPSAVLSAAQLRSAVGEEVDTAPQVAARASEPFGDRLQRLRKERGMSLATVASELGVSKPTVWAWEQGRARPVAGRIEGLAQLLEVPAEQLLSGREHAELTDVVVRCRQQIATLYGTSPDHVRVMIEL